MTVADLIDALKGMDPKSPVMIATDYGDITHTTQLIGICEVEAIGGENLSTTAYSESGLCITRDRDEDEDEDAEKAETGVVVVSGIRL